MSAGPQTEAHEKENVWFECGTQTKNKTKKFNLSIGPQTEVLKRENEKVRFEHRFSNQSTQKGDSQALMQWP